MMIRKIKHLIRVLPLALCLAGAGHARAETFEAFLQAVWKDAAARGIERSVFDRATKGLAPDPQMDRLTRQQPELVKPIGDYIERRTAGPMLKLGQGKIKGLTRTLSRIEQRYGIDPYVVVAIWGMESGYGSGIGNSDVFQSLATLGWRRYRGDFFRNEFLDALQILQYDVVGRVQMIGSWAGAMGQTQFMPSNFLKYAVDFNGDGKRDVWHSTGDALGSTANYLAQKGWVRGQPWGVPVTLPKAMIKNVATRTWQSWTAAGVTAFDQNRFPSSGEATLFFPAGEEGPTFLITDNYEVIRDYNSSDAYSLSVGLLANRLGGGKAFRPSWPSEDTLNKDERMEVQTLLEKKGFPVPNRTGRIIKGVRLAIRDFQLSIGVTADGYPDEELLRQLRR